MSALDDVQVLLLRSRQREEADEASAVWRAAKVRDGGRRPGAQAGIAGLLESIVDAPLACAHPLVLGHGETEAYEVRRDARRWTSCQRSGWPDCFPPPRFQRLTLAKGPCDRPPQSYSGKKKRCRSLVGR